MLGGPSLQYRDRTYSFLTAYSKKDYWNWQYILHVFGFEILWDLVNEMKWNKINEAKKDEERWSKRIFTKRVDSFTHFLFSIFKHQIETYLRTNCKQRPIYVLTTIFDAQIQKYICKTALWPRLAIIVYPYQWSHSIKMKLFQFWSLKESRSR